MQIQARSPFRATQVLWQKGSGLCCTVVCKATFALRPGECGVAPEQDPLFKEDQHWGHDPMRSLRAANDLGAMKPRADVVLVGHAYAPNKAPLRSLVARLQVGAFQKAVEVWCPRFFDAQGRLQEGPKLAQFALLYDRAAAGHENPAGVRPGTRDAEGRTDVPSIVPVGAKIATPSDPVAPVGLGPIAPAWPLRYEKLGRYRQGWNDAQWYRAVLGDDFDFTYFQIAPPDQQIAALRGDEKMVLENLHPEHAVLTTALPGIKPTAQVEIGGRAPLPVPLQADTLFIDTGRGVCSVVWRGRFPVENPQVEGMITIGRAQVASAGGAKGELEGTVSAPVAGGAPAEPILPTGWAAGQGQARTSAPPPEVGLPFSQGRTSVPPEPPGGLPFSQGRGSIPPEAPGGVQRSEVAVSAAPQRPSEVAVSAVPVRPAEVPIPAAVAIPVAPEPAAMPQTVGQQLLASRQAAASAPRESAPIVGGVRQPEMLSAVKEEDGPAVIASVAAQGALGLSNAALTPEAAFGPAAPRAEAGARTAAAAPLDGELLRLVWHDPEGSARVRRKPEYRPILGELDRRLPDADLDASGDPADIEDRRELLEIMVRASPEGPSGVRALLNEGMREDGKFAPLVAFMTGELEHVFDPIDMLKALLPAAASFVNGEDALKSAVDAASSFLGVPGIPSPGVAESLCARIKKAFADTRKSQKPEALTGQAERALCEQRLFQRRGVFGDTYVRSLLWSSGSPHAIPVYFPEAAVKKLPMAARSRVRLLAETHLRADPYESHPAALRVLALAEVLPGAHV